MMPRNEFQPDYVVSPGEILEEILETKNLKKNEFAKRCGRSAKTISQIIAGVAPITPELAIRFQRVLGSSASLWNNLEANYRLQLASTAENKKLSKQIVWAKTFPVQELVKRQFIEKPQNDIDLVGKILHFFGIGSVEAWEGVHARLSPTFRHSPSFKSDPKALAAWLRIGTLRAETRQANQYDEKKFRQALELIRSTTLHGPEVFEPILIKECADAGVVVVLEPEFKKTRLSGMTRWLTKDLALIMLSLRHKSDDHFWFTFFHEAAHVLLHRKHSKKRIFIDAEKINEQNENLEVEANKFAANFLIPPDSYRTFVLQNDFKKTSIRTFAKQIGISPGIVVGRLQRDDHIPPSWNNDLKQRFEFKL